MPPDSSYFSPNAPASAAQSTTAPLQSSSSSSSSSHATRETGPVITASVTSKRHAMAPTPLPHSHSHSHSSSNNTIETTLHQFALHIPAPPARLVLPVRQNSTASSSSSSSLSSTSTTSSVPGTPTTLSGSASALNTPGGHHGHGHGLGVTSAPSSMGGYPRHHQGQMRAPSLSVSGSVGAMGGPNPYPHGLAPASLNPSTLPNLASISASASNTQTRPTPRMTLQSSSAKHSFSVLLPPSIAPEMVTISANKGDRLRVVADAWHVEEESHYEWQISFPPYDIDMSAVQAKFDTDGRLTIDVRRRAKIY